MRAPEDLRASRRVVFHGLGALGVAAALAGCAGSNDDSSGGGGPVSAGTELTTTQQVPVGGGIVLTEHRVVVTQPTAGEFAAFTAVCTHQQLSVTSVADGVIHCANHGSEYDAATGAVRSGPAPSALAEVAITVAGDRVLTA